MRAKSRVRLIALFMIVLVLALPFAFAQNMSVNQTAVPESIPLEVFVSPFSKSKYVDVNGTTAPNARLEYFIGPTKVKVSRAKEDGTFVSTRIPMIKKGENDLLVKASVEGKAAQKSFTVDYDPVPPDLTVSDIPEFTTRTSLEISGDVSEPVFVRYTSYPKKDTDAPLQIIGLEMREIKENQVTMAWIPSDAADLLEYAVYRDGKRIGVARSAIYVDNDVASGKEYQYRVAAVDTSCNEGVKSAPKKAVTPPGGDVLEKAVEMELSCVPAYKTLETAVPFDITVALQAGGNVVEIMASDKAGNTARVEKFVTVDTGPPQFITTNLDTIGTTYIPEITIQGNLSEQGTVFVYINDEKKPSHFGATNDQGGFEIPVKLKSDVKVQSGQAAELDTGVGWQNKIKLKAVDLAGQEVWYPGQQQSKEVVWAICGYGAWLDFDIEEITPGTLTPRLLMQGIQQIGIPFTLKYIGGQEDADIAGVVNLVPVRIAPDLEDAFDNDKISNSDVWIKPRPGVDGVWDGFIQINFVEWPVDQLDLEGNETAAAVEEAISNWRKGQEYFHQAGASERGIYLKPGCLNPLLGCMKLYLELDIPLKEKVRIYDPNTQQERFEWKTVRQRNCVPIILDIDQVIPPDVVRKDALKGTSRFLGNAITLIDEVLDPLYTFTENMVYLCMGAAATLFILSIAKRVGCSPVLEKIGMGEKFDPEIAQAGLCAMAYGGADEQEEKYENDEVAKDLKRTDNYRSCASCQDATQAYRDILQDVYQPICDRISCPSAPTVQKYILDKRGSAKKITSNINALKVGDKPDTKRINWIKKEWGVKGDVYSGNSCGFKKDLISTSYTVSKKEVEEKPAEEKKEEEEKTGEKNSITGSVITDNVLSSFATGSAVAGVDKPAMDTAPNGGGKETKDTPASNTICGIEIGKAPLNSVDGRIGIKDIYEIYKGDYKDLQDKCTDPSFHPACPLCCGIEYMWEWNSACGVGNFLGITNEVDIDTYDELKHSTKLAAEKVGRGDDIGGSGLMSIFNSLSGFCTAEGNPTPDIISTHLNFNPKIQEAEENIMQVFVFPDSTRAGDQFKYRVYRGYLAKTFVIENAVKEKGKKYDLYSFSSTLSAVKEDELTQYFRNLGTEKEAADKKAFSNALCKPLGGSKFLERPKPCSARAPEVFEKVKNHISTVEEEYIIRPDSSIINSMRCICLSSLIAFLEQWRQIAQAIKNCIDSIILTGDGDEGMCRSMLSNYVCDLLWEIITCFANKWSMPTGTRISAEVGVGDVLGIITGAGTDVSNNVEGRYGETAMFNAMFNEKEIVHGLCYLAFGLEWNLDVSAMVQQSVESVPVETMVLGPAPAQARFIAWNPVTNPRGLTTWEYHFGLMISAGADINTRVKLKCSTGFGCSEADGFVGGECDCNKLGDEKVISINPTCKPAWKSRLNKNELASYDCSYTVQAGKYRYDTIIFEYDWQDPGTKERRSDTSEAAINRIGSSPPIFCKFDLFSLSYRCQFGESPSGIKIEAVDPLYEYTKDNREVFAMDKDLEFELSIMQVMPDVAEEMEQGIKYLGYKVLNSENKVVKELDPKTGEFQQHYQFKTDGAYKQKVEIRRAPDTSWENSFAAGKGTAGSRYKIDPWTDNVAVTNKIKPDTLKYIDGVSIKATKDGKTVTPDSKKRFFVDIKDNAIGMYEAKARKSDNFFATSEENRLKAKEETKAGKRYSYTHIDDKSNIKYEISFRLKTVDFGSAKNVQFLIQYVAGKAAGDPCAGSPEDRRPVTWKVTFTSYDADKYGRVTDQKSVNPQTGEVQETTIPIQVVCANANDLKKKEVPEEKEVAEEAEIVSVKIGDIELQAGEKTFLDPGEYPFTIAVLDSVTDVEVEYSTGVGFGMIERINANEYAGQIKIEEAMAYSFTVKAYEGETVVDEKKYIVEARGAIFIESAILLPEGAESGDVLDSDKTTVLNVAKGQKDVLLQVVLAAPLGAGLADEVKADIKYDTKSVSWTLKKDDENPNKYISSEKLDFAGGVAGKITITALKDNNEIEKKSYKFYAPPEELLEFQKLYDDTVALNRYDATLDTKFTNYLLNVKDLPEKNKPEALFWLSVTEIEMMKFVPEADVSEAKKLTTSNINAYAGKIQDEDNAFKKLITSLRNALKEEGSVPKYTDLPENIDAAYTRALGLIVSDFKAKVYTAATAEEVSDSDMGVYNAKLEVKQVHGDWGVNYVLSFKAPKDVVPNLKFCKKGKTEKGKTGECEQITGFEYSFDEQTGMRIYEFYEMLEKEFKQPHLAWAVLETNEGKLNTSAVQVMTPGVEVPSFKVYDVKSGKFLDPVKDIGPTVYYDVDSYGEYLVLSYFDPPPATKEENRKLCDRIKLSVSDSVKDKLEEADIGPMKSIQMNEQPYCANTKYIVPKIAERAYIGYDWLSEDGEKITGKTIVLNPKVHNSYTMLLNDGRWHDDYEFRFRDDKWEWREETDEIVPFNDMGMFLDSDSWWTAVADYLYEHENDYIKGVTFIVQAANERGNLVIKLPVVSPVEYDSDETIDVEEVLELAMEYHPMIKDTNIIELYSVEPRPHMKRVQFWLENGEWKHKGVGTGIDYPSKLSEATSEIKGKSSVVGLMYLVDVMKKKPYNSNYDTFKIIDKKTNKILYTQYPLKLQDEKIEVIEKARRPFSVGPYTCKEMGGNCLTQTGCHGLALRTLGKFDCTGDLICCGE